MRWKTNTIPQHTLSVKYLKQIMTEKEYDTLIKKYLKAKERAAIQSVRKGSATGAEK